MTASTQVCCVLGNGRESWDKNHVFSYDILLVTRKQHRKADSVKVWRSGHYEEQNLVSDDTFCWNREWCATHQSGRPEVHRSLQRYMTQSHPWASERSIRSSAEPTGSAPSTHPQEAGLGVIAQGQERKTKQKPKANLNQKPPTQCPSYSCSFSSRWSPSLVQVSSRPLSSFKLRQPWSQLSEPDVVVSRQWIRGVCVWSAFSYVKIT